MYCTLPYNLLEVKLNPAKCCMNMYGVANMCTLSVQDCNDQGQGFEIPVQGCLKDGLRSN